jgi:hypothetical protein
VQRNRKAQNVIAGSGGAAPQLIISQATNRGTCIGEVATQHHAAGNMTKDDLIRLAGGALVATIEGSATRYHLGDHLSTRVLADASGNKIGE